MSLRDSAVGAARRSLRAINSRPALRKTFDRIAREVEMASRPPVPSRIRVTAAPSSMNGVRLNRLCGPDAWEDPAWLMYNRLVAPDENVHRKNFEWTQCVYGLDSLGVLRPDSRTLGVGAGHEPIIYYLANRCALCVATDIYEGHFTTWEAGADFLEHPESYAPFPYRRDHLHPMRADGRALPFPDEDFDVVFSLSSIEHFGGHHAAAEAMREMARVVKPGGVVCVATEWIIQGGDHFEYFRPEDFHRYVIEASGLELVEPLDETPPPKELIDDPVFMDGDIYRVPQVVMGVGDLRWTSVVVFLRKP